MQREQEYLTPSAEPAGNGSSPPGLVLEQLMIRLTKLEMPPAKAWVSF